MIGVNGCIQELAICFNYKAAPMWDTSNKALPTVLIEPWVIGSNGPWLAVPEARY
ncbi:hypothetical protein COCHEDRAFT_1022643, partial [Bipolaris maydis C5]